MVRIDEEVGVYDPGGCVLDDCMWSGVVHSGPVSEGVGPCVCAEEILAVDCCGYVGEDGLYVAFDSVLPLLLWRGALVSALLFLVKQVCFVGAECGIVIAS